MHKTVQVIKADRSYKSLSKNNARVFHLTELHQLKGVSGTLLLGVVYIPHTAPRRSVVYALYLEAGNVGSIPGESKSSF